MTAAHPTDDTLAAYGLGRLDDTAAGGVVRHLDGCDACRRRVAELTADSFVGKLRAGRSGAGYTGLSAAVRAMPAADDAAVPPELLALTQYAGLRELGRGGMGVVYVARNTDLDRLEVLKVVQRASLERVGAGAVDRFLREMQAAARLQHPNVVTAYAVHRPGDLLVFAMEYAPGQDLAKLVKAKGPLPVPVACSYAHAAALGLQHAHEAKMVHRDVKPGNLILTRVNGKPTVKVLDFGLAKVTTGDRASTDLTGDGKMMGTPDYMAPEQALDAARADVRADVYALGCTLYHLLAGRPPFAGGSLLAVIDHHRYTEATPLNLVQPTVPAELAAVVGRMMAKDPAKRYQTPLDAAKAVRPFIGQPAVKPAAPPAPRPNTADTSRPEQTAPEQPAPLPPGPAADWAAMTESRPRPAAVPVRRRPRWAWPAAVTGVVLLALAGAWAAGVFVKVRTPAGTIVIEGVPDGAEVTVDGAAVTVTRDGEAVTLTAVQGEHTLRVVQNGVELAVQGGAVVKLGGQPVTVRVDPPAKPAAAPPPKPADPPAPASPAPPDKLVAGSVWHGTRTYTKGAWAPGTVNFELHILKRDGTKFSGHVFDNGTGRNESQVIGDVTGTAIRWTETSNYTTGKLYLTTGTLDGTTIRASQTREVSGKHVGDSYVVLNLTDVGKEFRKGDPVPLAPPAEPKAPAQPPSGGFVPLFNGKNLDGWVVDGSDQSHWSVTDDSIIATSPHYRDRSYLLTTHDYTDYTLRFDFQVTGDQTHGGVAVRAVPGEKVPMTERNLIFDHPIIKLSHPGREARDTTGTSHWLGSAAPFTQPSVRPEVINGRWHAVELTVRGDTCVASFDGKSNFTVTLDRAAATPGGFTPGLKRTKGRVGFQINTGMVLYRNVRIKELPGAVADDVFIPLFNGKDKTGWSVPAGVPDEWTVTNGVLVGRGPRKQSLLCSNAEYADFHLRAEYRVNPTGNSGIFFRSTSAGPPDPVGYEAEIWHGRAAIRDGSPTGALRDGMTVVARPTTPAGRPEDWCTYEVVAVGNVITLKVNDSTVVEYTDPRRAYTRGRIALQKRDPQTVVEFRKVEVKPLDAIPPAADPLAAKAKADVQPLRRATGVDAPPNAAALLKVALASRQKPLKIEPPKDLSNWGDLNNPSVGWATEADGILTGTGRKAMTHPRTQFANFHLTYEAVAGDDTYGGAVIRNQVRRLPNENGRVYTGYYIPINTSNPNQTGRIARWRAASREDSLLAASTVRECQPQAWHRFEVVAIGSRIAVFVDGAFASYWDEPNRDPLMFYEGGFVSFRVEHGMVSVRNIEIKELDAAVTATLPPPKR